MEDRIGQYTIVEELGRGGMGVVYKAHDPSLDRFVAIKVLGTHLTQDASYVQRFDREARAAAALNHPNIVQIYTVGEDAGRHYFVMEYVKGTSVQELIRKEGRLEPARAAGIILQAASGLAAAHGAGILHRDIKPGNLMVDERGIVKIADFGLALAPEAATRLTATGMLMGTPGYLSPEQCMDNPADQRSDIYSLGATFFEMLAGRTPFTADSPLALLRKIVEVDPPDVGELNPDVDPELRRIVSAMMARDPAQRYQSCDEIVTDLRRWMEVSGAGSSIPAAGASRAAAAVATGAAQSAQLEETPTVLVEGGSGQAAAPPPPPPPAPPASPGEGAGAVPPPPQEAPAPSVAPATPPPTAKKRTVAVAAAVVLFLLLGLAAAGVVAWKFGAGPVAALLGSGTSGETASTTENVTTPEEATGTSDVAAAPQSFADVSGVEVEQGQLTSQEAPGQAPPPAIQGKTGSQGIQDQASPARQAASGPAGISKTASSTGGGATVSSAYAGTASSSTGGGGTISPAHAGTASSSTGGGGTVSPAYAGTASSSTGGGGTVSPAYAGAASSSTGGGGTIPPAHAGTASSSTGGGGTVSPAYARAASSSSAAHAAPAQPPAPVSSGTIVLAVGEDLAAGEAGRYLRERLSRAGIELAELDDFPRALDLVEKDPAPPTNAILSRLRGRAANLVLVRVEYLGSRELNYLGRGSTTTETGRIRITGSGLESQRTYTGGNPDQTHRSRLTVTCYDLATTHTLAPRWSTTVEYTPLNVDRNVEKALGKEAGDIIDLIRR